VKKLLSIILSSLAEFPALAIDPQGSHLSDENSGSNAGLIVFVAFAIGLWILISAIVGRSKKRKHDSIDKTSTQINNYKSTHNQTTTVSNVGVNRLGNTKEEGNCYVRPTTNYQAIATISKPRPKTYSDLEVELQRTDARKRENGTIYYPKTIKTIKGTIVQKRQHLDDYTISVDIQYAMDTMGKVKFTRWRITPHGFPPVMPGDKNDIWYDIRFNPKPTSIEDGKYHEMFFWKILDVYPIYFNIDSSNR